MYANSVDPDQTAADLGLHCLTMSLKRDAGLVWINMRWLDVRVSPLTLTMGVSPPACFRDI